MIDLERLAREADIQDPETYTGDPSAKTPWIASTSDLKRFAQLVAEEAAKIAEGELEPGSVQCAAAIREAFGIATPAADTAQPAS